MEFEESSNELLSSYEIFKRNLGRNVRYSEKQVEDLLEKGKEPGGFKKTSGAYSAKIFA